LVIAMLAVLLLYGRTGLAMLEIWERSETFAHAFLVPPISLWLIWRQRAALARYTPRPAPAFLLPMAAAAVLWLLGELVAVNSVTQLAYVSMLVLCVPLLLGWPVARALAFPLLFLFFAVPVGEFLLPQLLEWTADFTVLALRVTGIPVYREGLHFIIPSGSWSVAQACSGIRYLIASVMVGTLFAYLNYRSTRRRLIFVLISFLLPLLANWLRAYMIVMLGHLSGNKIATGVDHIIYGWIFFGIVMLLLFSIGMRWSEPDAPAQPPPDAVPAAPQGRGHLVIAMAALLVLLAPVLTLRELTSGAGGADARLLINAPGLANWQATEGIASGFKPHFEQPRGELQAAYRKVDGPAVGVYLAYYRDQDYRSKLISSTNVLLSPDDKQWLQTAAGQALQAGHTWRTADLRSGDLAQAGSERRLRAWQIFWVNGRWMQSDALAKLYAAFARLSGRGDDSAVLILTADAAQGGDALLEAFAEENLGRIDTWLSGVRDAGARAGQRQ
jgi:exosortase A